MRLSGTIRTIYVLNLNIKYILIILGNDGFSITLILQGNTRKRALCRLLAEETCRISNILNVVSVSVANVNSGQTLVVIQSLSRIVSR